MHGLLVLNWKRGGGDCRIRMVKAMDRPDLLPAFMKPAGLFYLPPDGAEDWCDPGPEQYARLLSRCDLVEITGGVDFLRAAEFCMEYLRHG
jgi:HprK-related kinase B